MVIAFDSILRSSNILNASRNSFILSLNIEDIVADKDFASICNSFLSKQKLVIVCQSMENYFYICPA